LLGSFHLLDLSVAKRSRGFALMSSAEVYGAQPTSAELIEEQSYSGFDILARRALALGVTGAGGEDVEAAERRRRPRHRTHQRRLGGAHVHLRRGRDRRAVLRAVARRSNGLQHRRPRGIGIDPAAGRAVHPGAPREEPAAGFHQRARRPVLQPGHATGAEQQAARRPGLAAASGLASRARPDGHRTGGGHATVTSQPSSTRHRCTSSKETSTTADSSATATGLPSRDLQTWQRTSPAQSLPSGRSSPMSSRVLTRPRSPTSTPPASPGAPMATTDSSRSSAGSQGTPRFAPSSGCVHVPETRWTA